MHPATGPLPAGLTRLPPGTFQLLIITATGGGSSARLTAYAEINGQWRVVFPAMPARIGARGYSGHRREGDLTTPTGMCGIGPTLYGLRPNRPAVPGRGSGVFLHEMVPGHATAGCVALARGDLVKVLTWLDPGAGPHIVLGSAPIR